MTIKFTYLDSMMMLNTASINVPQNNHFLSFSVFWLKIRKYVNKHNILTTGKKPVHCESDSPTEFFIPISGL